MIDFEVSAVGIVLAVGAVWTLAMFAVALVRGAGNRRARERDSELEPKIRGALINFLAGAGNHEEITRYVKESRDAVGAALLSFQPTVSGSALDRLCELALDQGLVHDW